MSPSTHRIRVVRQHYEPIEAVTLAGEPCYVRPGDYIAELVHLPHPAPHALSRPIWEDRPLLVQLTPASGGPSLLVVRDHCWELIGFPLAPRVIYLDEQD